MKNSTIKTVKPATSLENIDTINDFLCGSGLDKKALRQANTAIKALALAQNISCEEAMLLAAVIECSSDARTQFRTLAHFFNCSNVKLFIYKPKIVSLVEKGFLRSYDDRCDGSYFLPSKALMEALFDDRQFAQISYDNLDLRSFLIEYTNLTDERHYSHLNYSLFISEVCRLVRSNHQLPLCQLIEDNDLMDSVKESFLIFLLRACADVLLYNRTVISKHECNKLVNDEFELTSLFKAINKYSDPKTTPQIFEPHITIDNPFAQDDYVTMTPQFCRKYLDGLIIDRPNLEEDATEGILSNKQITAKKLFYNTDEGRQINELTSLLKQRNFKRIQQQLKTNGYRQGFACLFYGAPGTGKTESVMQLAKATGRDILQIDLSQIRDKYVGESEKRTKAIFDDYRRKLNRCALAPILLLNEADGLLAKRLSSIDHSADQLQNTMQNIILQEMESFEGIMIATTNLTCNLDSAFERRFLYKVEFHKPSVEARQSIWRSMIHDLKPLEARAMAEEFEFSGGEIENIARKYVVGNILHNTKTDIDTLRQICRSEKLTKSENRKRIGF